MEQANCDSMPSFRFAITSLKNSPSGSGAEVDGAAAARSICSMSYLNFEISCDFYKNIDNLNVKLCNTLDSDVKANNP
jgi:hypothetical protein